MTNHKPLNLYHDLCPVDELTILKNTVYSKNNLFYSNKQRILTKECKPDLLSDFKPIKGKIIHISHQHQQPFCYRLFQINYLNIEPDSVYISIGCLFHTVRREVIYFIEIGYDLTISKNITDYSSLFVDLICNYPAKSLIFINELYNLRQKHLIEPSCS